MASDPLPADLSAMLAARRAELGEFARTPVFHLQATSTNDVATCLAATGAHEGTWVLADEQVSGRGRRGRAWASPPGAGLYLSVIFRPPPRDPAQAVDRTSSLLPLTTGVAVAQGIARATGFRPALKWPNDVMVPSPADPRDASRWRKLAGILAEGWGLGSELHSIIVGLGINLRPGAYPPDVERRATSLEGELGRPVDRATLLGEVLIALAEGRRLLLEGQSARVLDQWRTFAPSSEGHRVRWRVGEATMEGVTQGIDESGALLVRTVRGVEPVIAGEVRWS